MLGLDSRQSRRLVVGLGQCLILAKGVESGQSILVAVIGSSLIPFSCLSKALFHMNANLVVVAHGEFSSWQFGNSRLLSVLVCQRFVLLENALITE